MVYRRANRPSWYSEARARGDTWRTLCWRTPDRRLALKMEAMWEELAKEHRAWDVLDPVLGGSMTPGALYDLYVASGRDVDELRRRMRDTDLEPIVEEFLGVHARKVVADTLAHIRVHLRALMPEGQPFPRSLATTETLTKRLYAYAASPSTIRKVHSDWSGYFRYCTRVKGLFQANPMDTVDRPPKKRPAPAFYDIETVERIVGWQPTEERRVLFALLYGTAMEISVALALTRADVFPATKEIRAAGTKAHTRDRMVRVADWAWPRVWAHVEHMLPTARVFPAEWHRSTCSDWHRQTVGEGVKGTHGDVSSEGLRLSPRLPLKNARHHWAVRAIRAGTPIKLVQAQLGHATATLTLDTYGLFQPQGEDRAHWEREATKRDAQLREAQ